MATKQDLELICQRYLSMPTRAQHNSAELARQQREQAINGAAHALAAALQEAGYTVPDTIDDILYWSEYESDDAGHSIYPNRSMPDRAALLSALSRFWHMHLSRQPSAGRRDKPVGHNGPMTTEAYGPAIDFLIATGTPPSLRKGQKEITADIAQHALSAYRAELQRKADEQAEGERALADLWAGYRNSDGPDGL